MNSKFAPAKAALVALAIGGVTSTSVSAQQAQPSQSTETYGDWTYRCQVANDAAKTKRCEIVQIIRDDKGGVISQAAFGLADSASKFLMVVQVPQGVLLTEKLSFETEDGKTKVGAPYVTCIQNYCLARTDVEGTVLKSFGEAQKGFVSINDQTGRPVKIAVSFNGMRDALSKLQQ